MSGVRSAEPRSVVRLYLLLLGTLLLVEGGTLLVAEWLSLSVGVTASDTRHNLLHVAWGGPLIAVALTSGRSARAAWAAVTFGVFYLLLGVAGLVLDRPFGLLLGPGENAFHFTVGPLALLLGVWALRSSSASNAARSAAGSGSGASSPAR